MSFDLDGENPRRSRALTETGRVSLADFIADHDVIVNCLLQNTNSPLTFLRNEELDAIAPEP